MSGVPIVYVGRVYRVNDVAIWEQSINTVIQAVLSTKCIEDLIAQLTLTLTGTMMSKHRSFVYCVKSTL